ncbi:MFS transporter [Jatrophihabitans endophyticus]|uniref:MFS transporter n=1 Tax=Jatrophihabitans endophyticus TaxID=1206085 RepID=UPI001A0759EE|nr:MFS transporter [Jatrophihabitans endophyticus]MBE7186947.1 MFS transporter [Jatrophihabitans endophyticus]
MAVDVAPLPSSFRRLWASDALSTAGDGFTLVAAPLLALTLTDDPTLVALTTTAQFLPWMVFGLLSGALVDRYEPRRLIIGVDLVRGLLFVVLAVAVWTHHVDVGLLYAVLFLSGAGDTVTSTAATSLTPRLVERDQLTRANSRLLSTRLIGGSLVARPLGAVLFLHGPGTPFAVDAVSFGLGCLLLVGVPSGLHGRADRAAAGTVPGPVAPPSAPVRPRVRDGLAMLWADPVLRILALCILVMNVTLAATMSVLVLVARDRLGLGAFGYGLLLAALAAGGLIGTVVVRPLLARFGPATLLTAGLVIEAATHLGLALTRSPWLAGGVLVVFGVHAAVWSVLTLSLRQHRIEDSARGRVGSAYQMLSVGGAALGGVLGGLLVETVGLTAPMWFGAVVVALVFAVAVRSLRSSAIELGHA